MLTVLAQFVKGLKMVHRHIPRMDSRASPTKPLSMGTGTDYGLTIYGTRWTEGVSHRTELLLTLEGGVGLFGL